jgi:type IV secretion system protein VirB4
VLDKSTLPDLPQGTANPNVATNVPIVCHYDPYTLITKNGELVQTIEITGESRDLSAYASTLRDDISKAITESVKDYKVAIYLHTIRSRKNVMPTASFNNEFANKLNDDWCTKNNFNKQLINTIYITFVYQGSSHSIINISNILKSLVYSLIKKEQLSYLEDSYKKLEAITNQTLSKLSSQGARRLGLIDTKEGVISEQIMFYYHLMHLEQRKVNLALEDISSVIAFENIKFNFNSIEIDNPGNKRYAALFSIKDYYDIAPETLDQLLQLGFEYVLTQTIIFVPPKEAVKEFEIFNDIAYLSKNDHINKVTGVKRFIDAENDGEFAYCKHQTTITIFSDDVKFFQERMKQASKSLHNLGISCIREDFNMAALFWGQMPGNLRFLTHGRFSYLDTKHIGAYCTIFDKEVGNYQGSKWGPPISLIRTDKGTAFYFNFHNKNGLGHTLLIGPAGSGKTVVSRFLITQALKVNPNVLYLDLEGNSKNFIEAINGTYMTSNAVKDAFKLNPFTLQSFKRNTSLFKEWLIDVIFPKARTIQNYDEVFNAIAVKLYENIEVTNKIEALCTLLANLSDSSLNQSTTDFFKNEKRFPTYFTEGESKFDLPKPNSKILGIDLSEPMKDPVLFKAYMGVFLEYILKNLPEGPIIIYISKLDALYSITHLKQVFSEWLRVLDSKNGIMIANCEHHDGFEHDEDYKAMTTMLGTKIFLSDKNADKYFRRCYDLTDDELHKIKSFSASRRNFLLKQDDLHKMLMLNLSGMKAEKNILDTGHDAI